MGGYSAGSANPAVDTKYNVMSLDGIRNELEGSGVTLKYEKGWITNKEKGTGNVGGVLPGADIGELFSGLLGPSFDMEKVMGILTMPKKHEPEDSQKNMTEDELWDSAVNAAAKADYVIVIAGTDSTTAAEEFDRTELALPYGQDEKIQKLLEVNPNTIVVLITLSSVTGNFFDKAHTVVNAHYAGQEQGTAIANILFGAVNPSGRLTNTWYKDVNDLPHLNDYGLRWQDTLDGNARTYMYFKDDVLFPFGYGLSYTTFEYSNLCVEKPELDANDTLTVSVDVTNTGSADGAEVVELYIAKEYETGSDDKKPIRQLKGFSKVFLKAGECRKVTISVPVTEITFWSAFYKKMMVEAGTYRIEIGRSSADIILSQNVQISGTWDAEIRTVYLTSDKRILNIGESAQINCSVTLEDAAHLKETDYKAVYKSSNPAVLKVDENGYITAVATGSATVIAAVVYKNSQKGRMLSFAVK